MRFVGRVAIILIVAFGAAVAHSMVWPITRDIPDAIERRDARTAAEGGGAVVQSTPSGVDPGEPEGLGDQSDPTPVPAVTTQQSSELPDYYISVARAYELWEEGMPFVDARTDSEREVGTVEGSYHLETRHFITGMSDRVLAQLDPAFPVVVFCAGGDCDASENVAQRLIGRGYIEVYVMHEGFGAWKAAGHPTEQVGGG